MEGVEALTRPNAGWTARLEALGVVRVLAERGDVAGLRAIVRVAARGIEACVADRRSTVVKEACAMLVAAAAVLGPGLVDAVGELVTPALVKNCAVTIAVVRETSADALRVIFAEGASGVSGRTVAWLASVVEDRRSAPGVRAMSAELVGMLAADEGCFEALGKLSQNVVKAVMAGCTDPDERVRALSRANCRALQAVNPECAEQVLEALPGQVAVLILEEKDFEDGEAMPPASAFFARVGTTAASENSVRTRAPRRLVSSAAPYPESAFTPATSMFQTSSSSSPPLFARRGPMPKPLAPPVSGTSASHAAVSMPMRRAPPSRPPRPQPSVSASSATSHRPNQAALQAHRAQIAVTGQKPAVNTRLRQRSQKPRRSLATNLTGPLLPAHALTEVRSEVVAPSAPVSLSAPISASAPARATGPVRSTTSPVLAPTTARGSAGFSSAERQKSVSSTLFQATASPSGLDSELPAAPPLVHALKSPERADSYSVDSDANSLESLSGSDASCAPQLPSPIPGGFYQPERCSAVVMSSSPTAVPAANPASEAMLPATCSLLSPFPAHVASRSPTELTSAKDKGPTSLASSAVSRPFLTPKLAPAPLLDHLLESRNQTDTSSVEDSSPVESEAASTESHADVVDVGDPHLPSVFSGNTAYAGDPPPGHVLDVLAAAARNMSCPSARALCAQVQHDERCVQESIPSSGKVARGIDFGTADDAVNSGNGVDHHADGGHLVERACTGWSSRDPVREIETIMADDPNDEQEKELGGLPTPVWRAFQGRTVADDILPVTPEDIAKLNRKARISFMVGRNVTPGNAQQRKDRLAAILSTSDNELKNSGRGAGATGTADNDEDSHGAKFSQSDRLPSFSSVAMLSTFNPDDGVASFPAITSEDSAAQNDASLLLGIAAHPVNIPMPATGATSADDIESIFSELALIDENVSTPHSTASKSMTPACLPCDAESDCDGDDGSRSSIRIDSESTNAGLPLRRIGISLARSIESLSGSLSNSKGDKENTSPSSDSTETLPTISASAEASKTRTGMSAPATKTPLPGKPPTAKNARPATITNPSRSKARLPRRSIMPSSTQQSQGLLRKNSSARAASSGAKSETDRRGGNGASPAKLGLAGAIRAASQAKSGSWTERYEALIALQETCKGLQGQSLRGKLAHAVVMVLGDYLKESHYKVVVAALDALFYLLLSVDQTAETSGHPNGLQMALERQTTLLNRVLARLRDSKENIRLGAERVMQSFVVQFSPEVRASLILRAMCGSLPTKGFSQGTLTISPKTTEAGCSCLLSAFESAQVSGVGFIWQQGLLEAILLAMSSIAGDRRSELRRGATNVLRAARDSLPDGAMELACRRFRVPMPSELMS